MVVETGDCPFKTIFSFLLGKNKLNFQSHCCQAWWLTKFFFFLFFFLLFLGPHLLAHGNSQARGWIGAVATATRDPSGICDLHHSSRQGQILNPLSEARNRTCILMDTSLVHYLWAMTGTPWFAEVLNNGVGSEWMWVISLLSQRISLFWSFVCVFLPLLGPQVGIWRFPG